MRKRAAAEDNVPISQFYMMRIPFLPPFPCCKRPLDGARTHLGRSIGHLQPSVWKKDEKKGKKSGKKKKFPFPSRRKSQLTSCHANMTGLKNTWAQRLRLSRALFWNNNLCLFDMHLCLFVLTTEKAFNVLFCIIRTFWCCAEARHHGKVVNANRPFFFLPSFMLFVVSRGNRRRRKRRNVALSPIACRSLARKQKIWHRKTVKVRHDINLLFFWHFT